MNKFLISIIIVVVIVGYMFLKSEKTLAPGPTGPQATSGEKDLNKLISASGRLTTYNDLGYSPNKLTIKSGETVTFKNESAKAMWTASSGHPSHMDYSNSSLQDHCPDTTNSFFDSCAGIQPNNSWSFTFTKKGTWKFHNHLSPSHYGSITVE